MFAFDAIEIRFVEGEWGRGPCKAWFRLRSPLVAGENPTPLQLLAAAGDFGNGISATLSWDDYLYINPDLTLYVEREPVGDWICLESETRIVAGGIGIAESVLYDLGRSCGPRHPGVAGRTPLTAVVPLAVPPVQRRPPARRISRSCPVKSWLSVSSSPVSSILAVIIFRAAFELLVELRRRPRLPDLCLLVVGRVAERQRDDTLCDQVAAVDPRE